MRARVLRRWWLPCWAVLVSFGVWTNPSFGERPSLQAEFEELQADPVLSKAARDPLRRAKEALAKARRFGADGPANAQRAASVAEEWLRVAQDLKRALAAEERAAQLERDAERVRQQVAEERTFLEQSGVNKQRLEGIVQQLEAEETGSAGTPTPSTVEAP